LIGKKQKGAVFEQSVFRKCYVSKELSPLVIVGFF